MRWRKWLCVWISVLAVSTLVFSASAAQTQIYAEPITARAQGDVLCPVRIRGNPGLMGFKLTFLYDSEVLNAVSVQRGEVTQNGILNDSIGVSSAGSLETIWSHSTNVTADGVLLCEQAPGGAQQDAFGHRAFLSGAGGLLAGLIHEKLGCKARAVELSLLQRCASHLASAADLAEAEAAGRAAVKAADAGDTGVMIAFARAMQAGAYRCDTVAVPVSRVANEVRAVPREWITPDGMQVTQQFRDYALPLIQGEVDAVWKNGVPQHISL